MLRTSEAFFISYLKSVQEIKGVKRSYAAFNGGDR